MKTKTQIDPVPPCGLVDLTAQFEAVRADVAKAQAAAADAEARMVENAIDPAAFEQAKREARAATTILAEHQTRLDALTKLLEKHSVTEYQRLRDWLQRRADRVGEKVKADLIAVLEERRAEEARHKAAVMVLDWREQAARYAAKAAEEHAVSVYKIADPAAARVACENAQAFDELSADPALVTLFAKQCKLDAQIIGLVQTSNNLSNAETLAAARRERAAVGEEMNAASARLNSCKRAIAAALEIKP